MTFTACHKPFPTTQAMTDELGRTCGRCGGNRQEPIEGADYQIGRDEAARLAAKHGPAEVQAMFNRGELPFRSAAEYWRGFREQLAAEAYEA